ncbi:MAG: AAC(3)-I family aminoglycoside N-acetyltransferase [Cyanobacteria bacterium P01_H01_bin.119]
MGSTAAVTITRLSSDQIEEMRSLLAVFGEAFDEVEVYCGAQPSADYLKRFLSAEHYIALVAQKEDEVVGGLVAYELQKFEQERSEIYIYDLAVAIAHRREGIATRLLQTIQQIAVDTGACAVYVQADQEDDPAIALYTKLASPENVLHFDIPIKGHRSR